jgi:hypothetical protein
MPTRYLPDINMHISFPLPSLSLYPLSFPSETASLNTLSRVSPKLTLVLLLFLQAVNLLDFVWVKVEKGAK